LEYIKSDMSDELDGDKIAVAGGSCKYYHVILLTLSLSVCSFPLKQMGDTWCLYVFLVWSAGIYKYAYILSSSRPPICLGILDALFSPLDLRSLRLWNITFPSVLGEDGAEEETAQEDEVWR
jgi:hypothetical protein